MVTFSRAKVWIFNSYRFEICVAVSERRLGSWDPHGNRDLAHKAKHFSGKSGGSSSRIPTTNKSKNFQLLKCYLYPRGTSNEGRTCLGRAPRDLRFLSTKMRFNGSRLKRYASQLCVRFAFHAISSCHHHTGPSERVVPRLRELAPRGQREPGGGIHVT